MLLWAVADRGAVSGAGSRKLASYLRIEERELEAGGRN
jgi:hypothetical protein